MEGSDPATLYPDADDAPHQASSDEAGPWSFVAEVSADELIVNVPDGDAHLLQIEGDHSSPCRWRR